MTSLAAKHFQKYSAAAETSEAENGIDPKRTNYELLLGKLALDRKRLKQIKSVEKKIETKSEIVSDYDDYLNGVIQSDAGIEDIVLTTLMLWNIDAGNFDRATELAEYAIVHGLAMPPHIERATVNVYVEEMVDQLLKLSPDELQAHGEIIKTVMQHKEDSDQMDQVSAKAHKLAGIFAHNTDPEKALEHYKRAVELNPNIGLKTTVTKMEKSLKEKPEAEKASEDDPKKT